jgi:hypothetical protein
MVIGTEMRYLLAILIHGEMRLSPWKASEAMSMQNTSSPGEWLDFR